jgi:hypothetical protein
MMLRNFRYDHQQQLTKLQYKTVMMDIICDYFFYIKHRSYRLDNKCNMKISESESSWRSIPVLFHPCSWAATAA